MSSDRAGRPRANLAVGRLVERARDLLAAGWSPLHAQGQHYWARRSGGVEERQDLTPADGVALDALTILGADTGHGFPHSHPHAGHTYHHRHRGGHRRHTHLLQEPE